MTYSSVSRGAPGYPPLLAELHDPPARLHLRGGPAEILSRPAVAVVGARSCSAYGAQVARDLGRRAGRGRACDRQRARARDRRRGPPRRARRGRAHGRRPRLRDRPRLPSSARRARAADCRERARRLRVPARRRAGALALSGTESHVAGLASATVVVEARERSGALITADFALELGRDVFAVPGEITSGLSKGTNDLIRQGATPLLAAGGRPREPGHRAAEAAGAARAVDRGRRRARVPRRRRRDARRDLAGDRARRARR